MKIQNRPIGATTAPYVVAEMSANHMGSFSKALDLVSAAADCGCDAIKIQLFDPRRLARARGGEDKVILEGPWAGKTLLQIYEAAAFHFDWIPSIQNHAARLGITLFASVFDEKDVSIVETFDMPAIKISSFDCTNLRLIAKAGETGLPMIISTGMASLQEVAAALGAAKAVNPDVALLHCVSEYPAPFDQMNIWKIDELHYTFQVPVGLSDHCPGPVPAIAAVARGAVILEKHLTLSHSLETLDKDFSLDPEEMSAYVSMTYGAWASCLCNDKAESGGSYEHLRVKTEA